MDKIQENIPRVKDAISKLDSLDEIISTSEGRFEALQDSNEWLAKTEERLHDLDRKVTEKLKALGEVTKSTLPKLGPKDTITPSVKETVINLAHSGWDPETIAARLGLSVGAVELILGTS